MKKRHILSVTAGVILFGMVSAALAAELVVSGSTTVQGRIFEPAAEEIEKATGISVKIRGIGSGGGFKELMTGKVKVSMASSPLRSLLEQNGLPDDGAYREHVIITDDIVPIINTRNTVRALTWAQLKAIHVGEITNWKAVGGEDCPILVVTSHSGSATRKVFQELVMEKAAYLETAKPVKSTRQEVGRVAKSTCAIGVVSRSFVKRDRNSDKIRIVQMESITRPLILITKGRPSGDVKELIAFLMSPQAKKAFE